MFDPRHGRARGQMIQGSGGASLLRQLLFVILTLVVIVGLFIIAGTLLSDPDSVSPTSRFLAYGGLGALALVWVIWQVRRRRARQSLDVTLRSRRR